MEKKELRERISEVGIDYEGVTLGSYDRYETETNPVDEVMKIFEQELDKAREEGREELLDSIVVGIKQLKSIVEMFNPMSIEIRAKQSGEIEAYNGLLEKLSNLKTKEDGK